MSTEGRVKRQKLNQTTALLYLVEFLVFNSIHKKKSDEPKTSNREEYGVISGWPLSTQKYLVLLTGYLFFVGGFRIENRKQK